MSLKSSPDAIRGNFLLPLFMLVMVVPAHGAQTVHATHPDTGLSSWDSRSDGALVHLTQLTPDQVRAFFLNRGMSREAVERYAASCVFMTIVKNEAIAGTLRYRLTDWRVVSAAQERAPWHKEQWLREWEKAGVSGAARIAFEWAQLPTEQQFEQGDWNQGMTSYALSHGEKFDLHYRLEADGRTVQGTLKGARCAEDR